MNSNIYDVIISGGGLAGNTLAWALRHTGLRIALIEAQTIENLRDSPAGDRALALAAATVEQLTELQLWQAVADQATPIKQIHVSDQGHFGKTRLSAAQQGVSALGYVISARPLEVHLAQSVADSEIFYLSPAKVIDFTVETEYVTVNIQHLGQTRKLRCRLLVGADGGESVIRSLANITQQQTDYGQSAIVTQVQTTIAHQFTAYERFTPSGPLALLPIKNHQAAVVWTRSHDQAQSLLKCSEKQFIAELQSCFGYYLGQLHLQTAPRLFPLRLIRARQLISERVVIIGNAAHQLHPVAGQGFNLGLRDVIGLTQHLREMNQLGGDCGTQDFLRCYQRDRLSDHQRVIRFTDSLVKLFSNNHLPLTLARNLGLTLLDQLPFAKRALAQQAMGFIDKSQ
ncbi:MAG: hypothetical protein RL637_1028 [Pseudomonadota bacterium]|jgi:2-octaprenyl-6-methoxyphenol hydroxylase